MCRYLAGVSEVRKDRSKTLLIFLPDTISAAVSADIAAHLPEDTVGGFVYLAGLPYVDREVMAKVGKPFVIEVLSRVNNEESTPIAATATQEFVDSLFLDPEKVPWETKAFWLGMAAMQLPRDRVMAMSRPQDPEKLQTLGKRGLPLLILGGVYDRQVDSKGTEEVMKPDFPNMKVT